MKTSKELAQEWAEEHHITAITDKKDYNILFAKKLAAEAYFAGYEAAMKRVQELSKGSTLEEEILNINKED